MLQCLCNQGWTGPDCSNAVESGEWETVPSQQAMLEISAVSDEEVVEKTGVRQRDRQNLDVGAKL